MYGVCKVIMIPVVHKIKLSRIDWYVITRYILLQRLGGQIDDFSGFFFKGFFLNDEKLLEMQQDEQQCY